MFTYLLPPIALAVFCLGIALVTNTICAGRRGFWSENTGVTLVMSSFGFGLLLGWFISISQYGL